MTSSLSRRVILSFHSKESTLKMVLSSELRETGATAASIDSRKGGNRELKKFGEKKRGTDS